MHCLIQLLDIQSSPSREERLRRVLVELPEPAFSKLEKVALQRGRTVSNLVEEVITGLLDAFVLPEEEAQAKP